MKYCLCCLCHLLRLLHLLHLLRLLRLLWRMIRTQHLLRLIRLIQRPIRMNPNPTHRRTVATLLNSLFYYEFLSVRVEYISNHALNDCHGLHNNHKELTFGRLHLFFVVISLCMRACICEKWDEAVHSCAWSCECAPHFGRVHALHSPAFACFQFRADHPGQFRTHRMLTRVHDIEFDAGSLQ